MMSQLFCECEGPNQLDVPMGIDLFKHQPLYNTWMVTTAIQIFFPNNPNNNLLNLSLGNVLFYQENIY